VYIFLLLFGFFSFHLSIVAVYVRVVVLLGGALLALFGSAVLHFPGSGALAVLTMAFTAGNYLHRIFFYFKLCRSG
jgi:hypothetical protein